MNELEKIHERRAKQLDRKQALLNATGTAKEMLPDYSSPMTEFEVHAELYSFIKGAGFKVRGELATKCRSSRFDLLVYSDSDEPMLIIEVKRQSTPAKQLRVTKRNRRAQVERYRDYGIPVRVVYGLSEGMSVVRDELGITDDALSSQFAEIFC